ncbi:MFS family permease [Micromonospora luteifusca]|uniref:MFS family permease n=1 Tax=Micromonospora luteifusca TaxID=709860 RepID=A0ABS2M1Q4_9ACTN|nr:MFS transporter [Micromonospora luteifusca]MBM7494316.1 MFS family permease [Micromonospora luteifusca]
MKTDIDGAGPAARGLGRLTAVGRTTWLLSLSQALYFGTVSIDLTLTAVVGLHLAPRIELATLPLAMITIVATVGSVLAGLLTSRIGYRAVMIIGAAAAVVGGGLSVYAVVQHSFFLLCVGTGLVGLYRATGGYIRFLAADLAPDGYRERALSFVLFGGLLSAFGGPFLATASVDFISTQFAGPYLMVALLSLASIPLVLLVTRGREVAKAQPKDASVKPVAIREVVRSANFTTALLVLTVAGATMTMIMAVGPIGSEQAGHSMHQGASIIQWHLVGMFAPSIFSGALMQRIGRRSVAVLGCALLLIGAVIGSAGSGHYHFLADLALNGLGWNFLFLSGSAYLIACYPPGRGGRVQAAVEGVSSGAAVMASLSASAIYNALGWRMTNVPVIIIGLFVLVWLGVRFVAERSASSTAPLPETVAVPEPTQVAVLAGTDDVEPAETRSPRRT